MQQVLSFTSSKSLRLSPQSKKPVWLSKNMVSACTKETRKIIYQKKPYLQVSFQKMHYKNVQKTSFRTDIRIESRSSCMKISYLKSQKYTELTLSRTAKQRYVQLLRHMNRINKAEYRWKPIMHAVITNTAVVNLKLRLNEVL